MEQALRSLMFFGHRPLNFALGYGLRLAQPSQAREAHNMSFDLQFVFVGPTLKYDDATLDLGMNYEGLASVEEQGRIRALSVALVQSFEGSEWGELQGGISNGAWVEGETLPEISIGARSAFLSSKPDPDDPETVDLFKKLLSIFESHGYVCFDLQRGEVVRAVNFTFG